MTHARILRTFVFGALFVAIWELFIGVSLLGHRGIASKTFQQLSSFVAGTNAQDNEAENPEDIISTGLNQHMWEKPCPISLEQLCNYPIFPKAPDNRSIVQNADVIYTRKTIAGIRMLGYLRPNVTGEYHFLVASNGFAEVWLSTSQNWKNAKKIAYVNPHYSRSFEAMKSQISDGIRLSARKSYYFEVLYVQDTQQSNEHVIQVAWKPPDKIRFDMVDSKFFSPYYNDSVKSAMRKIYDDNLPDALACVELQREFEYLKPETRPFLEHAPVERVLNVCKYEPSYIFKSANLSSFKRFHGVHRYTRKTSSYPFPQVVGVKTGKASKTFIAEYPLDAKEAIVVASKYFEALNRVHPRKYKLLSIKRVEKKEDPLKGNRYFLELVVKDLADNTPYILAEYVYQPRRKRSPLCYPDRLRWNRTADVYLILTAKNLGRWIHHFIKNVEKILQETKDEHLHVVVYDFGSQDIDLRQAFQRSALKNYYFITKPGNYSRTVSFTEAIESIKDLNAIVVTIDLHLDIGSQFVDDVRMYCIKGKTVYAPEIVYLDCNGSSALPKGSWYHYSYGTIATYKQDWQNFGGFSADFIDKVTWGGEDWDLIDNAVKGGLEIERKRSPWVYHYYHSKKGMWQKKRNTTATPTTGSKSPKISSQEKKSLPKRIVRPQKKKAVSPPTNAHPKKEAESTREELHHRKETLPPKGASVTKHAPIPK